MKKILATILATALGLGAWGDGTTVEVNSHSTLQSAIQNTSVSKIVLADSFKMTSPLGSTSYQITRDLTLDFNGQTLTIDAYSYTTPFFLVGSAGKLTITDSSAEGTGKISVTDRNYQKGIIKAQGGAIVMEGGTIEWTRSSVNTTNYMIDLGTSSGSSFTMNGGRLSASGTVIYTKFNYGTPSVSVTINGGTLSSGTRGYVLYFDGVANAKTTVSFNDGTFECPRGYLYYSNNSSCKAVVSINGGDFTNCGYLNQYGPINSITGGSFDTALESKVRPLVPSGYYVHTGDGCIYVDDVMPPPEAERQHGDGTPVVYESASTAINEAEDGDVVTLYAACSQGKELANRQSLTIILGDGGSYSGSITAKSGFHVETTVGDAGTTYTSVIDAENVYAASYDGDTLLGQYESVGAAVATVNAGAVVKVVKVGGASSRYNTSKIEKDYTLDLNGQSISADFKMPGNRHVATIIDSVGGAVVSPAFFRTDGNTSTETGSKVNTISIYGGTYVNPETEFNGTLVYAVGNNALNVYGGAFVGTINVVNQSGGLTIDRANGDEPYFTGPFISQVSATVSQTITSSMLVVKAGYFTDVNKDLVNGYIASGCGWESDGNGGLKTYAKTIDGTEYTFYRVVKPLESVTLDRDSVQLEALDTVSLTATVVPEDATYAAIEWSSSNPDVASVENGVVTAHRKGTAVITVKSIGDPERQASCTVTVNEELVIGELVPSGTSTDTSATYTVPVSTTGESIPTPTSQTITAQVVGGDAVEMKLSDVKMENVVTKAVASADGLATSIDVEILVSAVDTNTVGEAIVYEVKPEAVVTVTKGNVSTQSEPIELSNDDLAPGASFTIQLDVTPLGAKAGDSVKVAHKSDDPNYADETYFVQAFAGDDGKVYVRVTVSHFSTFTLSLLSSQPVTTSVQSANLFGAVKISGNVASNMYVAVPFEGFESAGAARAASNVVHAANLTAGAKMFAYDKENDRYNVYEVEGGAWKAPTKVTVTAEGKTVVETAELGYGVAAGTGVILQRPNSTGTVYVYGQIPAATASVTFEAGQTLVSPPYTNATVGVGGVKYVDLNAFTWTGVKGTTQNRLSGQKDADYIQFRNTNNSQIKYFYLPGKGWGVTPRQVAATGVLVEGDRALIPVGTAFWYYSNAGGAKVEWKCK